MSFIVRMLRYLFWLLVISWSVAILQKIVGKMVRGGTGSEPHGDVPSATANQKLVRDPICGMHVAEGLAVPLKYRGETLQFCSVQCREKFLDETPKISVSA
jgi:YHS domain-containing protein